MNKHQMVPTSLLRSLVWSYCEDERTNFEDAYIDQQIKKDDDEKQEDDLGIEALKKEIRGSIDISRKLGLILSSILEDPSRERLLWVHYWGYRCSYLYAGSPCH